MSRVRVCLFVLFLVLNITVQFGDCKDTSSTTNCNEEVSPGSDETHLSYIEDFLKLIKSLNSTKNIMNGLKNDEGLGKSFSSSIKKYMPEIHLILPGTLWCGDGDIAEDKDDLGTFNKTDACCRAHDNCKSALLTGDTLENLKNNGIFTRSACACDNAFYDCLKDANTVLSKGIGKTYFNILGQQCFQCVCPTDDCDASTDSTECKDQCDRYKWVDHRRF